MISRGEWQVRVDRVDGVVVVFFGGSQIATFTSDDNETAIKYRTSKVSDSMRRVVLALAEFYCG